MIKQDLLNTKKFKIFIENLPGLVFAHDKKGNIILVNKNVILRTGYSKEELLKMKIADIDKQSVERDDKKNIWDKLKDKKTKSFRSTHITKNGNKYPVEIHLNKITFNNDEIFLAIVFDITEKIKIEKKIKENEQRLNALFESAKDAIFLMKNGKFISCNTSAVKMFEYNNKYDILGLEPWQISPEKQSDGKKSKEKAKKLIEKINNEGNNLQFSWTHKTKNNKILECDISLNRVKIADEFYLQAIVRDITEKKQLEKAVKKKNEKLGEILSQIKIGVIIFEPDLTINWVNNHIYEMFAIKNPIGKKCYKIFELRETACPDCAVKKCFETGEIKVIESYNKALDRWFLSTAQPIAFSGSKTKRVMEAVTEITKFKKAEKEIIKAKQIAEKNEKQFKELFVNMEQGFALFETVYDNDNNPKDFKYILVNNAFEKLTGLNSEVIIGKTLNQTNSENKELWIKNFRRVISKNIPFHFENYSSKIDKYHDIVAYSPIENYVSVIFTDITQNKNYEKKLLIAKEKAEESNRLKTAFLHNISHEFRTPLNGILGFSDLLINSIKPNGKNQLYVKNLKNSCYRLLDIVTDTIEISQIQNNQLKINKEKFNLNKLIDTLTDKITSSVYTKNLNFIRKIDFKNLEILSDKDKIYRSLKHLLDNAIKFTHSGKIILEAKILKNKNVFFAVKDTGIGISEKLQKEVFKPFRQKETGNTRNYGGNGIGLSLVKSYIKLLGGKIQLESELNKGTCISFTLPTDYEYSEIVNKSNEKIQSVNFSNKKILIVEDEQLNTLYLDELLRETKAKIIHAQNGKDAINKFKENPDVSVVLMDIKMPIMDGYEATKEIKRIADIPVIAHTAYALSTDKDKINRTFFDDYVSKPIEKEELYKVLSKNIK